MELITKLERTTTTTIESSNSRHPAYSFRGYYCRYPSPQFYDLIPLSRYPSLHCGPYIASMARSRKRSNTSRRSSAGERSGKLMLRFTKQQVDAFMRPRPFIKKEEPSPPPFLPSPSKTRTGREALKTTLRPVRSVILRMWNGSRIGIYPAERLAIRW